MKAAKSLLILALMLPVAACTTYSLEELRTTPPKGTPFQAALATYYLRFAEEEAERYDWVDSGYFADKGLVAAYGNDVPPESLDNWNLTENQAAELEDARKELVSALTPQVTAASPKIAASAQYYFDCWIENADENWQADEIAYCRDGFENALRQLALPRNADGEPLLPPIPDATAPVREAYMVFFDTNQDKLDDSGQRIVRSVVQDLERRGIEDYTIVLNGHTDTSGSKRYNFELSQRRAEAVLDALVEQGIPKMLVRAFGFGETDPAVATGDGVDEPKNRRVEIFFGDD